MSASAKDCEVLVVGAGPVGLFLAGELKRQGVNCRLIDKSSGPCNEARATQFHPRSLEIFAQVGLFECFVEQGVTLEGTEVYHEGDKVPIQNSLQDVESPFPFDLSLPQSRTERILIDHLKTLDQPIERNVELVSLVQDTTGVQATLQHKDGNQEVLKTHYLVGCDGAHSQVRHELGLTLEGRDYPSTFIAADVRVKGPLARNKGTIITSSSSGMFFGPLPQERFIFSCDVPAGEPQPSLRDQPTPEEIQDYINAAGRSDLIIYDPVWLTYFRCHLRIAQQYQVGQVFLAGDAAHIQSPAAGQGMNTGIQDGFNLAWKLALVLRGKAPRSLLESYHAERYTTGKEMLKLTAKIHESDFKHHTSLADQAKQFISQYLVHHHLLHSRQPTVDQTRISYHHSPIILEEQFEGSDDVWHHAPNAGDRAPDCSLTKQPDTIPIRLFDLLKTPQHHLLIFQGVEAQVDRSALWSRLSAIAEKYEDLIQPHLIFQGNIPNMRIDDHCLYDETGETHKRYAANHPSFYLIRPDGYIGYRSPSLEMQALEDYLSQLFL